MGEQALSPASRLLFYLASARDPQRTAVGPALAAAAERAGWRFECYYDDLRKGRHFGGGDPDAARPGWPGGSLAAGGRHTDQVLWLSAAFELAAVGDPDSILWPTLEAARAEVLARSTDPAELYGTVFERLGEPVPETVLVLDCASQGRHELVVAPYLYPALLAGEPALAVDAAADAGARSRLEKIGAQRFSGLFVDSARAAAFPGGLDGVEGKVGDHTYAALTAELAERHAHWGHGVLIGDPALVAAQLPRASTLRLLPLYGRPQTEAIDRAADIVRAARDPLYGRQYDDRDFFAVARLGRGLQVLDPDPPFEAIRSLPARIPPAEPAEPDDERLAVWAEEGRVLVTLLFWAGMIREIELLPRLLDLVAETGVAAGLLFTTETLELAGATPLELLAAVPERGGVCGLLEPLLASTGRGVAAESLMPRGVLAELLKEARSAAASRLAAGLAPRGWWPLLDARPVPARAHRVGWRSRHPVVRFTPRAPGEGEPGGDSSGRRDVRGLIGQAVRALGLDALLEQRRPFDDARPGPLDPEVVRAVRDAGFSYMWSKSGFGEPAVLARDGDFVALSLTAGNWDGWSPFYTVADASDLRRAERRLLRRDRPGWLAGTIDSPLWAMSGEVFEHGSRLYAIAELAARGGASGKLVNVTPNVVARYARMLEERGTLSDKSPSQRP